MNILFNQHQGMPENLWVELIEDYNQHFSEGMNGSYIPDLAMSQNHATVMNRIFKAVKDDRAAQALVARLAHNMWHI